MKQGFWLMLDKVQKQIQAGQRELNAFCLEKGDNLP